MRSNKRRKYKSKLTHLQENYTKCGQDRNIEERTKRTKEKKCNVLAAKNITKREKKNQRRKNDN